MGVGKSTLLTLLKEDIKDKFTPDRCVAFTRSLKLTYFQAVYQQSVTLFNGFNDIILQQTIANLEDLNVQQEESPYLEEQENISSNIDILMTLRNKLAPQNLHEPYLIQSLIEEEECELALSLLVQYINGLDKQLVIFMFDDI